MRNQFAVVLCRSAVMIWAPVAALPQSTSTPKGPSFEIADVHQPERHQHSEEGPDVSVWPI